jgi:hypothetical protein
MARLSYSTPATVLRKFDPTLDEQTLAEESLFASDDREKIVSRIEGVEGKLEDETGHAWRSVRVGAPGHRGSYESHDASFRRHQYGVRVWLDHREVVPIDPDAGDTLLLRTGRNSWRDVTDLEGQMWRANYPDGELKFHAIFRYASPWRGGTDDSIRACYRYGGLGGSRDRGGETSLAASVTDSATTLSVTDAGRLPDRGILLVGGEEYVSLSASDYGSGELTVTRGERGTSPAAHDAGTTVGYCPISIREAVAAKAAKELVLYDDMADNLAAPNDSVTHRDRLDAWEEEWTDALAKNAEARML